MQPPKGFRGRFLTDAATRAAYAEGAGIYRIPPAAVALPAHRDDLVTLVRWAGATATPLVPRGAGSGMPGGNVGPGVVVDLTFGFRGPIEMSGPLRAAVPAGRRAAELGAVAKPLGLRLPVDPSSMEFCTLGGMAATNAAGPRSRRYGSMRRWVEGLEVVFADGSVRIVRREAGSVKRDAGPWRPAPDARDLVARRFPRTRKNSSGYALDAYVQSGDEVDLLVGSEGTLGFITMVETRLDPIPPDAGGLLIGLADLDDLPAAVTFLDTLN
ncbi:MAG: FAD-binding oxidoreductase, partial [Gemmatimonadales bacterium]